MQAPLQARNDSDAAQTDIARTVAQKRVLADNRPEAAAQRQLAEMMNNTPRVSQQQALSDAIHNSPRMVAQRHEINAFFGGAVRPLGDGAMPIEASPAQREEKTNNTGLPTRLKSGIESLSGMSMDHVTVHYNSNKPAQLQAHAYAQGSEIHVGAGQERHLPHEAWHIVQQAQGRVRPTLQMEAGLVNDDPALEKEADMMGEKAIRSKREHAGRRPIASEHGPAVVFQHFVGLQRVLLDATTAARPNPVDRKIENSSRLSTGQAPLAQRFRSSVATPTVVKRHPEANSPHYLAAMIHTSSHSQVQHKSIEVIRQASRAPHQLQAIGPSAVLQCVTKEEARKIGMEMIKEAAAAAATEEESAVTEEEKKITEKQKKLTQEDIESFIEFNGDKLEFFDEKCVRTQLNKRRGKAAKFARQDAKGPVKEAAKKFVQNDADIIEHAADSFKHIAIIVQAVGSFGKSLIPKIKSACNVANQVACQKQLKGHLFELVSLYLIQEHGGQLLPAEGEADTKYRIDEQGVIATQNKWAIGSLGRNVHAALRQLTGRSAERSRSRSEDPPTFEKPKGADKLVADVAIEARAPADPHEVLAAYSMIRDGYTSSLEAGPELKGNFVGIRVIYVDKEFDTTTHYTYASEDGTVESLILTDEPKVYGKKAEGSANTPSKSNLLLGLADWASSISRLGYSQRKQQANLL